MKVKTQTTSKKTISLSGEDIVKLLRDQGLISGKEKIKKVFVQIPGGGDWSNCQLSLEGDEEVQIVMEDIVES